jgi:hypothetical protein
MDSYHYPFVFKMKEEGFRDSYGETGNSEQRGLVAVQGSGRPVALDGATIYE